jgi:hypothetical protein
MVEFAVLAPIFFLLLLGTIDLGRAVYTYNAISNAAREGARAAVQSKLGGGFTLTVDPLCAGVAAGGSCPTIPTVPNTGFIWYGPGIGQVTGSPHPIQVKITFLFQPWIPVVRDASGNGVTFSAETTMETEY